MPLFDRHISSKKIVDNLIYSSMSDIIMKYVRDDKEKWAKRNFEFVLKNVLEWGELQEQHRYSDIKNSVEMYTSSFKPYDNFENVMCDIECLKMQFCKRCRKNRYLFEFSCGYTTCGDCRSRDRIKRFEKKVMAQLDSFKELFIYRPPNKGIRMPINHSPSFCHFYIKCLIDKHYSLFSDKGFVNVFQESRKVSIFVYIPYDISTL